MSSSKGTTISSKDRISNGQKFAYGLGSIVNNLLGSAIGFMSIVLNVGLGINPALVGTLQAIPRFTDALTDPIMGFISDKTRSRFGRRRPYIFIGAIGVGLVFALMWQLPAGNSEMFYFWFFLIGSIIFYLFYTIFATPWVALGYELTNDYHERTRLMAVMNFMGQFAWITLPWFYAFMENDTFFDNSVEGARGLAIMIGIFAAVVGIMPAIFCKEKFVPSADEKHEKVSLWVGLKENIVEFFKGLVITLKRKDFLKLCIGTFFLFNSIMLVGAFSSYITIFYVSGGDQDMGARYMGLFGTINTASTLAAIAAVAWISERLGKRRTFMLATFATLLGSLLKWVCYDPMVPWKVLLPAPLIAIGMGGLFTLMGSMIADVCDLDELETGERREGMFGSIYWWMVKLGMALAFALSGYLLNATGFDVELGGAQTSATFDMMIFFDVAIPVVAAAISILAVYFFKITEERSREIRKELELRHEAKKLKSNPAT
ncbi:MAG: MFS transporter [Melioribacteraceae bacterium]|nr:MFS transporter [Melioribacteraceae bacterium]MCF8265694.1 MFS transporter [Melioribacteraceae bacterium]MCF8412808.1 MFS transporter [Melioribacteraceae bacterium]MCF8431699.1 MFS transporter [Melioribacteraceae bacterium]